MKHSKISGIVLFILSLVSSVIYIKSFTGPGWGYSWVFGFPIFVGLAIVSLFALSLNSIYNNQKNKIITFLNLICIITVFYILKVYSFDDSIFN